MSLSLDLSGFGEAIDNIRKVNAVVDDEEMTDSSLKAMQPIADTAKDLAPVLSGELRDSIIVSTIAIGATELTGGGVFVGPLASVAIHAVFIEFGTVNTRAQPFMAPAVDANEDLVFDLLGKDMGIKILQAI